MGSVDLLAHRAAQAESCRCFFFLFSFFFCRNCIDGKKKRRVMLGEWRVQRASALSASKRALRSLCNFTIRRLMLGFLFFYFFCCYHQQSSLFCHLCQRSPFDPGLCVRPHWVFVALMTSFNARVGKREVGKKTEILRAHYCSFCPDGESLQNGLTSGG